jgi:hypothetical protein
MDTKNLALQNQEEKISEQTKNQTVEKTIYQTVPFVTALVP